ncbi:MAG TPA: DUF5683 domain-containing protein [Candidatus Eisenbacteria bacterium]|nr:DUF5683 domain-containing protein [Candidatus Eisenbacteria bacterium]
MRALAWLALALGLAPWLAPAPARAEDQPPTLVVRSRPTGAWVRLQGERGVLGRTPFELTRPLVGRYRLSGDAPGYERWRRSLDLGGGADTVWMVLAPKHRVLGAARSLVVPGWGSFYAEHPTHGWVLLAGDVAFGAVWGVAEKQYRDKSDLYDQYAALAVGKPPGSTYVKLRDAALTDRDDARDFRDNVTKVAAGWWGLAVLDALVAGPARTKAVAARWDVSPAPGALAIRFRF